MKSIIKAIPIIGPLARKLYRRWYVPPMHFNGSKAYWIDRYRAGGNSGDGSYRKLAEFKAEILNQFIREMGVESIVEFGCGDGNQLKLAEYPSYVGFDVSPEAVRMCQQIFGGDRTKEFRLVDNQGDQTAEMALSLDVIYHLVEDAVFHEYMTRLFVSAERFVAIYSSNVISDSKDEAVHVRHRRFSDWIEAHQSEWELIKHVPNRYPFQGDTKTGSFADFYIYRKR